MEHPLAQLASADPEEETASFAQASTRVRALLRALGLRDSGQLDTLAELCVQRARLRVRERSGDELNRRALEEARRHHDRWLGRALGVGPTPSPQELGRARTALLLAHPELGSRYGSELNKAQTGMLHAALPQPIPREAPLAMPVQRIEFVAMGSTEGNE